ADGSFNPDSAVFLHNKQIQPSPAAYELYSNYKPPLALQLAGLLLAAAVILVVPHHHPGVQHVFGVGTALWFSALYLVPMLPTSSFPWFLFVVQAAAFYSMATYLRSQGLHTGAVLVGAALFAFTSWFPLQYSAYRFLLCIIIWLPLLLAAVSKSTSRVQQRILFATALAVFLAIYIASIVIPTVPATSPGYKQIILHST